MPNVQRIVESIEKAGKGRSASSRQLAGGRRRKAQSTGHKALALEVGGALRLRLEAKLDSQYPVDREYREVIENFGLRNWEPAPRGGVRRTIADCEFENSKIILTSVTL